MLGECKLIQYLEYDGVKYYIGDTVHIINDNSEGSSKPHLLHYEGKIQEFQGCRVVLKTLEGGIVKLRIDYIYSIKK